LSFVEILPTFNAALNATSAVLLVAGFRAIKRQEVARHKRFMLGALGTSAVFLVFYLIRAALTGTHRFEGPEALRIGYLVLLFSHMVLAVAVVPMALRSVWLGLHGEIPRHRRLAKITWPIWVYVSVTGVIVYLMLYHLSGAWGDA
jgi:putative membrane protein